MSVSSDGCMVFLRVGFLKVTTLIGGIATATQNNNSKINRVTTQYRKQELSLVRQNRKCLCKDLHSRITRYF